MNAVLERPTSVSTQEACRVVGLARSTFYRASAPKRPALPRRTPRRLSEIERQRVLAVLNEDRFLDLAPAQVHAQLLDEGQYLCSVRTMHRVLAASEQSRERRDQLHHPAYAVPRLVAKAPNEVWTWDITKLLGPVKWVYFHLYVVLDIFSRFVVGWTISRSESTALAKKLLATCIERGGVAKGQLTVHADRGTSMMAKPLALLLSDLGVTKSHSRPRVSNDNPFSEAQFKTIKYRPDFPDRFDSLEHAREHCRDLFHWYSHEHRHSSLGMFTPAEIHHGLAPELLTQRARVLERAYAEHPERFPRGAPAPLQPPVEVWINRPPETAVQPVRQIAGTELVEVG